MQIVQLMMMLDAPQPKQGETSGASGVPGDVAKAFQDLMTALLGDDVDARSLLAAGAEGELDRVAAENLPDGEVLADAVVAHTSGQAPGVLEGALAGSGDATLRTQGAALAAATEAQQATLAPTRPSNATGSIEALASTPLGVPPAPTGSESVNPALVSERSTEQPASLGVLREGAVPRDVVASAPESLATDPARSAQAATEVGAGATPGATNGERDASAAFQRFASQQIQTVDPESTARSTSIANQDGDRGDDGPRASLADAIRESGRASADSGSQSSSQSGSESGSQSGTHSGAQRHVEGQVGAGIDPASGASGGTASRATPGVEPAPITPIAPGVPAPAALAPPSQATAGALHAAPPSEAVPLNVEWLAARGGGSARVQLHPRELGELQLTVIVRGQDVEVSIRAQEATAGQAVLASRDQLLEGLASRDLRMDGFEVRWDEPAGSGRGGRDAASPDGREHPDSDQAPGEPTPWQDDQRPIFVQSTTGSSASGVNSGVDLHV